MNKHIVLVIKWMQDKNSVTQQELEDNRDTAYRAYYADDDAAYYSYAAADAAYYAANAANVAAYDADTYHTYVIADEAYDTIAAEKWLERYFEVSGETPKDYL